MKRKQFLFVIEVITSPSQSDSNNMYILRDGNGQYQFATDDDDELIEYLKDPTPEKFDPEDTDK